jgi:hypothetical protein
MAYAAVEPDKKSLMARAASPTSIKAVGKVIIECIFKDIGPPRLKVERNFRLG